MGTEHLHSKLRIIVYRFDAIMVTMTVKFVREYEVMKVPILLIMHIKYRKRKGQGSV